MPSQDVSACLCPPTILSRIDQHIEDMCLPAARVQAGLGASPERLVKRSDSAIQRAYDAAPGPPSKTDAQSRGPPSAPPVPPSSPAPDAGALFASMSPSDCIAPWPDSGAEELFLGTAGVAPVSSTSQGVPASTKPGNELDELQRRFQALKDR